MSVISTRTIRAVDVPQGWIDDKKLQSMREQWSRKLSHIADTQSDGKWIVLAPGGEGPIPSFPNAATSTPNPNSMILNLSTTLQLYRLYLPSQSSSVASPPPKLTFVRNLYGQTGPISSLALSDGRCVSLGLNGSLWVWDLEAANGTEVSVSSSEAAATNRDPIQGAVAFDDRRIVTTGGGGVVVRTFDV
jgi:hypothetical protein